jgi:hypothetical protein
MNENREEYEQLADRAARLLAAVANAIMKASPEKLKGMEGNTARLLMCVVHSITSRVYVEAVNQNDEGDQVIDRCARSNSHPDRQAECCNEVRSRQKQGRCASVGGSGTDKKTWPTARPRDRGVRRTHHITWNLLNALLTHIRWPPRSEWS